MSFRLPSGGRLIDRTSELKFTFNGRIMRGFAGDTLASALLARDQMLMGRSFKYHRPRGVVASGAEEPNALMNIGEGGRFEPNQRATTAELFDGMAARSQNHWPSLEFDVGAINAKFARFLPAGFYYKTFLYPRHFWKYVFEPIIRQSAGLGAAPKEADADTYEHFYAFCDVLIVGGGVAGLMAARDAAAEGKRVIVLEQNGHWGGRAPVDGAVVEGKPADEWISTTLQGLENNENVTLRDRCMGAGVYDHGYVLGYERITDHAPASDVPRHRLWRIRAGHVVTATGALERPLSFAGNDLPGVMLASAVRDYVVNHAVAPGKRTVVVTNNDDAYRTAEVMLNAGLTVPAIIDARSSVDDTLISKFKGLWVEVKVGSAIAKVKGKDRVTGVAVCAQDSDGSASTVIDCDAVAMSGGWSPVVHLWSHCGGKLTWDEGQAMFRPDPNRPPTNQTG